MKAAIAQIGAVRQQKQQEGDRRCTVAATIPVVKSAPAPAAEKVERPRAHLHDTEQRADAKRPLVGNAHRFQKLDDDAIRTPRTRTH